MKSDDEAEGARIEKTVKKNVTRSYQSRVLMYCSWPNTMT